MRSFLLTGDIKQRNKFIDDFIVREKIASHSINTYSNEIKIKDAKEIRLTLSRKYSGKRLIIISEKINITAQNALLKSFEELCENVSIIISRPDMSEILDTVKSRFFVVNFTVSSAKETDFISSFLVDNVSEKMLLIDNFINQNPNISNEQLIDGFIFSYRKDLLLNIEKLNKESKKSHLNAIKKLLAVSNFIKFNNLNLRLGLESALL